MSSPSGNGGLKAEMNAPRSVSRMGAPFARPFSLRLSTDRGQLRGERQAYAGLTIALEEAAHLELAEGDEPRHAVAGPEQHLLVHADLDAAEGQRPRARFGHDRCLVADLKPLSEAQIVEVGRQPQARVDRVDARLVRPAKHEGPRVRGGGEKVLRLLALAA